MVIFKSEDEEIKTTKDVEYSINHDSYVWDWDEEKSYKHMAKGYRDGRYTIDDDESRDWFIETEDANS